MRASWNTTIGILFGLFLGVVAALSFEQVALDPVERSAWARWLYDWQQLLSGLLTLLAAGVTAMLLWKQLSDTKRQAAAAERQASLATADSLKRHLSAVHNLQAEIGSLDNCIGSIELFRASEHMDQLRETTSKMTDRVNSIKHAARQIGLSSEAMGAIDRYCNLAIRWGNVAREIERRVGRAGRIDPMGTLRHERELHCLTQKANAIREELLQADIAAQKRINEDLAPIRQQEAELRAILWGG
jgi:predicted O-linked N-acetylglucosamine transferase (SPINDLY family)